MTIYLKGETHRFSDNINTDLIISVKRKRDTLDVEEMLPYLFEAIDINFYKKIHPGDFIVAGHNFGCGSSREIAPQLIKASGVKAILAKSFARIFYRNSLNCGLIVLELNTDSIDEGDVLEAVIDTNMSYVKNTTKCFNVPIVPPSEFALTLIKYGGLFLYLREYPNFE